MYANTETIFLAIYQRLVHKFNNSNFTAEICWIRRRDASEYPYGIEIKSHGERLQVLLSLYNETDYEITNNYRWEYMDYMTGAIIKSSLDYTATDDEVIAFFQNTLATSDEVIKL